MGVRLHELVTRTQQPKQRGALLTISGNARPSNRAEIIIGRSLAACVHPVAAWQVSSTSTRALIVFVCFAMAYAVVLSTLIVL